MRATAPKNRLSLVCLLLAAGSGLLADGCGPTFKLEPLVGEDEEALALLGSSGDDLVVPETVAAVERFYRALWSTNPGDAWTLLSTDTRAGLDQLGQKLNSNGKALLQTRQFPKPGGASGETVKVSLAALFLVRRPTRFHTDQKPDASTTQAVVLVTNRLGERREVHVRRERGTWVVHHTDFGTLPPAVSLRPQLLPEREEPPAPEPPPQPEPAPAPDPDPDPDEDPDADPDEDVPEPSEPGSTTPPTPQPDIDF